jgi:peptide/nickel transport system permease protein
MYGARVSLLVGFSATIFATVLGVSVGLLAGYLGGTVDALLMRIADIQLTFPSILVALLIDGIVRAAVPREVHDQIALFVVILAIGVSEWPKFARTVRGSTLVERNKEYVLAARVIGLGRFKIMLQHVLPNVLGPVLVIGTLNLALAILAEATLSFLGVGVPPTQPSLGTLIRIGNDFLFSGEWWITIFPGVALIIMVLSVNLLGDWLRDALNPKLRCCPWSNNSGPRARRVATDEPPGSPQPPRRIPHPPRHPGGARRRLLRHRPRRGAGRRRRIRRRQIHDRRGHHRPARTPRPHRRRPNPPRRPPHRQSALR